MAGYDGATSGFRANNAWDACPPVALRALLWAQRMSVGPMPSAHTSGLASPSFSMQKAATTGLLGICTSARRHVSVSLRGQNVATPRSSAVHDRTNFSMPRWGASCLVFRIVMIAPTIGTGGANPCLQDCSSYCIASESFGR